MYETEDGAIIFYRLFLKKPYREMSPIKAAQKIFSEPQGLLKKTPEGHTVMSIPEAQRLWIIFKKEKEANKKLLGLFEYTYERHSDHIKCYL